MARLRDVYHVLRSVVIRFIRFGDSPRRGRGPEPEERKKLCVLSVSAVHPYSDYIAEALGRAVVDVAGMNAIKFIYFGYGGLRQLLGPERSSKT